VTSQPIDAAQEDGIWRAIGHCEGAQDDFEKRLEVMEKAQRSTLLWLALGLSLGVLLGRMQMAHPASHDRDVPIGCAIHAKVIL